MKWYMMLASWSTFFVTAFFLVVCFLMIVIVLIQKNRGSGLSGAFGGVGGHSAFGTKTGDVMTWFTVGFAGLFLLIAIVGNYVFEPDMAPPRAAAQPVTPTPVLPEAPAPADQNGENAGAVNPVAPISAPINPGSATQVIPVALPPSDSSATPSTPEQPSNPEPSSPGPSDAPAGQP